METNNTLTTTQVAALLHVSAQTIRDWTTAGKLPATTTDGGHRRYQPKDAYTTLHQENGHTHYWTDDACLLIDPTGHIETRWGNDPQNKYNNKPLTTADLQLLKQLATNEHIITTPTPEDLHMEGNQVTLYLQAKALTTHLDTAHTWLKTNAIPTTQTTTIWQTSNGQPIHAW